MVDLKGVLEKARTEGYAVGAFNVVDQLCMKAVAKACYETGSPVIIQVLPPVIRQFGPRSIAYWARALSEDYPGIQMVLHLDHGTDLQMISECIDHGWNSVMIDASAQSFKTNVEMTRQVLEKAHMAGVTVEGEVGCIFSVDEKQSVRENDAHLAQVNDCRQYCDETGVDALAPAIGTAHGLYKDKPNLNCGRLEEIANIVDAFLVIHGGTGLGATDFRNLVGSGANKINIATQIYMEYMKTLRDFAKSNPESGDPGEFFSVVEERISHTVKGFLEIFGCMGKAS